MAHLCFFSSFFKFVPKLREGPTGIGKIPEYDGKTSEEHVKEIHNHITDVKIP
jgi:hypothetical protein